MLDLDRHIYDYLLIYLFFFLSLSWLQIKAEEHRET